MKNYLIPLMFGLFCMSGVSAERISGSEINYIYSKCQSGYVAACNSYVAIGEAACQKNDALGCLMVALAYSDNTPIKNHEKALPYAEKACLQGHIGCAMAGQMNRVRDPEKFFKFNSIACGPNEPTACLNMGNAYDFGIGTAQNKKFAADFYKRGCDYRNGAACSNLAVMYRSGEGVRRSITAAITYYEKSCNFQNARGCLGLVSLYSSSGEGVRQDVELVKKYALKACDLGELKGCSIYSLISKHYIPTF